MSKQNSICPACGNALTSPTLLVGNSKPVCDECATKMVMEDHYADAHVNP